MQNILKSAGDQTNRNKQCFVLVSQKLTSPYKVGYQVCFVSAPSPKKNESNKKVISAKSSKHECLTRQKRRHKNASKYNQKLKTKE
jgi:hypothetical protein